MTQQDSKRHKNNKSNLPNETTTESSTSNEADSASNEQDNDVENDVVVMDKLDPSNNKTKVREKLSSAMAHFDVFLGIHNNDMKSKDKNATIGPKN